MLCLQLSVNAHGIGRRGDRAGPGCSAIGSQRRRGNTGGDPAQQRRPPGLAEERRREAAESEPPAGTLRGRLSPADLRRTSAGGPETRASQSPARPSNSAELSDYDTAVCSEFSESFSDCAETPPQAAHNDQQGDGGEERCANGATALRPNFGTQLGRKDGGAPLILTRPSESDSSDVLLWDNFLPCASDEAHFITTHEIQLYELDHDGDCEFAEGAGWDVEESSAAYSYMDASSLGSDASEEGSQTPQGTICASVAPPGEAPSPGMAGGRAAEEPPPDHGSSAGHIHLSIRASSRAVSETGKGQAPAANSEAETKPPLRGNSECLPKPQPVGEPANSAIPGDKCTVHANVGGKANSKGFEFSSGASSAVSELDDADKEVRTLTARAFRSLACPNDEYLDTYCASGRPSTGLSSLSEGNIALNRWAAYVDLQCRNAMAKDDPREFPAKNAKASIEPKTDGPPRRREQQAAAPESKTHLPPAPLNGGQENPAGQQTFSQIQLTGKFEQVGSRVITLTETLNFSYDVRDHTPASRAGGRSLELARHAGGSRCADAAQEPAPKEEGSEIRRAASKAAGAMEGAQKKSKFASNLLQSVIWKKMQFEQELKMERGEISDTSFAGRTSPPAAAAEFPKAALRDGEPRDVQRPNSSRISGGSSQGSPEPGEASGEPARAASDPEVSAQSQVQAATCEGAAGGGANPSKGSLLRSQHSAFRSWKDSGLEMQRSEETLHPKECQQRGQRVRAEISGQALCKETKMSHLFVPSIQKHAKETDPAATDLVLNVKYTTQPQEGAPCQRGDSTSNLANSKSPEIKIKLRSLKETKHSPFSVAKLLTPNIGSNATAGKAADESKCHAISTSLASDNPEDNRARVPQFTVRDIRDNIHKLQAPIHQVRDVRKLVKSSYHILTLDGNHVHPLQSSEPVQTKQAGSLLPIVIKCQSVSRKDLAGARHNRLAECTPEQDWSIVSKDGSAPGPESGGMQNGSAFVHRASGRIPLKEVAPACAPAARANASPPAAAAMTGAEKLSAGRQVASKQLALEKLTAAVKTMEQLYVFDKNEWKRKSEPSPGPLAGSHVLSLIASEEASCSCNLEGEGARAPGQDSIWNVGPEPAPGQDSIRSDQTRCKSVGSEGIAPPLFTVASVAPQPSSFNLSAKVMGSSRKVGLAAAQSPQPPDFRPLRAQRCKPWEESEKQCKPDSATQAEQQQPLPSEYENYLTIPVKKPAAAAPREPPPPLPAAYALPPTGAARVAGSSPKQQRQTREPSPATIYHRPQPQLLCFSPPAQPPEQLVAAKMHPPQPMLVDACYPLPQTQRKMLLDPTTGQCYLVDTPVQPARKRLFDPETGQYVEVPLPQQQPLSVPMSPIAINPGSYGTTYMLYPGFLPPPAMLPTQLSRTESDGSEAEKMNSALSQQAYMESPYYSPTGKSLNPAQTLSSQHRPAKGFLEGKPVISITSQQGPRIIAPPSFDGTTMSFVVEHR